MKKILLSTFVLIFLFSLSTINNAADLAKTEIISNGFDDSPAIGGVGISSISPNGRYVAFSSSANLVPNDNNLSSDVYLKDRKTGELKLIINSGFGQSYVETDKAISEDGRFIVFTSNVNNLVKNDTNNLKDIFVYDNQTGETKRISVSVSGLEGNGESSNPSISGNGRYIVFESLANNLVDGDTNNSSDIFVYDMLTGSIKLASISSKGIKGNYESYFPTISRDGDVVAFTSYATNLIDNKFYSGQQVYTHNILTGETKIVSINDSGAVENGSRPSLSKDGKYIVFESLGFKENQYDYDYDIFFRDTILNKTIRITVPFKIDNYNFVGQGDRPIISDDGNNIVFRLSTNLFLYNRLDNKFEVITKPISGDFIYYYMSWSPSISTDGRYIIFSSDASNLVTNDKNGCSDLFLRDRGATDQTAPTTTASISGIQGQNNWYTSNTVISLSAADEEGGTGVAKTEYSFDNINWTTYTTPITVEKEGKAYIYYRSTDKAGNVEAAKEQVILIDKTAPSLIGKPTIAANENGWYNTDVNVGFYADDTGSGVASVTPQVTVTTEGKGQSVVGVAVDNAGNKTTFEVAGINIDKTPPKIKGVIDTMTYNVGWYNTDVTVKFYADDNGSGIDKVTPEIVLTKEGEGQTAVGYAYDRAGNYAKVVVENINIDKTAPTVTSNLKDGVVLERSGVFTLENTASDNLSGIAKQTTYLDGNVIANTGEINLEQLAFGQHTMIVKAKDKAGNISNSLIINFTVTATIDTLKKLVDKYYAQGLIDNKGIYNSLIVKLNKNELAAFSSEVKAQKDKHIDGAAADRLIEYTKWVMSTSN